VEDAELSQHRPPVVIDSFAGQTVIGVECVYTAERELDSPPRRRKTTPPAEMRATNRDFNEDCVFCDNVGAAPRFLSQAMASLAARKTAGHCSGLMAFLPRLIIVLCNISEGAENAFKIVLVLKSNMVLNQSNTSRPSILRNRCACHIHLPSSMRHLG